MKLLERKMLTTIKNARPKLSDLVPTDDEMAVYDAYNDDFLVELKYRHQSYPDTTLIEMKKFGNNTGKQKVFIYGVRRPDDDKIYLFNINRLYSEEYDFGWRVLNCNKTTEFEDNNKIPKKVGFIEWNQADVVIPMEA